MKKVLKNKVWKCLWERKVSEIGLKIPTTLPQLIVEVVKVVDIGLKIPATPPQVIVEFMDVGKV